ncbi:hypothetical protein RchiOBHm_Chr6g0262041 [Rosa chinensis]|uniref:Uncharacterized protein n=1 Tax=Rosa chinensis TaxID=74649 RepID=A0A2P6PNI6_ROSCH|nr:hypothetical protein RchiOBHm_Chr6g0262041 [Rosa chinensis]
MANCHVTSPADSFWASTSCSPPFRYTTRNCSSPPLPGASILSHHGGGLGHQLSHHAARALDLGHPLLSCPSPGGRNNSGNLVTSVTV